MLKKYFDTSVLVAFYCPEELSYLAEKELLDSLYPVISSLTVVEFYSAIAKKIRNKQMTLNHAHLVANRFIKDIKDKKYKNIIILEKHYKSAKEWLAKFDVTLYSQDAIHLAISYHGGYNLITADEPLSKAAKYIGVDCKFLSE